MSFRSIDFVSGQSPSPHKKKSHEFNLCYAYPRIENNDDADSVISTRHKNPQSPINDEELINDGLYVSPEGPLTSSVIKPYQLSRHRTIHVESMPKRRNKLLEIGIRQVKIHQPPNESSTTNPPIEIESISVLFADKTICKASAPFNRKLYKLLLSDSSESNDLSLRVHSNTGNCSTLPLPIPRHCVKDSKVEINFSICDNTRKIHSGTLVYTISLKTHEDDASKKPSTYLLRSNDPNDPRNCLALLRPKRTLKNDDVKYFLLTDPDLCIDALPEDDIGRGKKEETLKLPDMVVSEVPGFSLIDLSLGKWLQAKRPLRPSSSSNTQKHRTGREEIVTITILRGVEVPVREESALVQPLVEINWGTTSHSTYAADGPAPVWQQTIEFEVPRHNSEQSVKLSLYDQHPIWGLQWLGDATIPLEFHRNYQEIERWIGLSPLCSPVARFGYVQASPGRSYTRIYILMKIERPGNLVKSPQVNSSDALSKSIQRCMGIPYKIPGIETSEDCARLTMLLTSLPSHYGPLTPKQGLKLNKIDDYGRAALLAVLLQGLGLDAYVLLGSSQARKCAAFVVSFDENGTTPCLWDPENGDHYDLGDSRCSLMKASRMINHQNIWKNVQKATTVPFNLRFNPKSNKDWQPLTNIGPTTTAATTSREVQSLELNETTQEDDQLYTEIESQLREKLSQWRSNIALTTTYNRHAVTILRSYLSKFNHQTDSQPDKKELRQLFRAYHTHGFILNLRHGTPNELANQLLSTKIHAITGPVEFALVCRVQKHIARTCSVWLAVVVLRDRD